MRRDYAAMAAALLAIETTIALLLNGGFVREYVGDALAVVLAYAALRSVSPFGWRRDLAAALIVAFTVELAQYLHLLERIGMADRAWARIVFGTSYDGRDLISYVAGATLVWWVERRRRRALACAGRL